MSSPIARGLTLGDVRDLRLDRVLLYGMFAVSLLAAYSSFGAQVWLARHLGGGSSAWALPLIVDGFAAICALSLRRSGSERSRSARAPEWAGLLFALGLSVAGNVEHALVVGDNVIPRVLVLAYGAAVPLIVAWGCHILGRSMARGLSAHVMVDAPDQIQMHVPQVGESTRKPRAKTSRTPATVRVQAEPLPAQDARAHDDRGRAAMRALWDAAVEADPAARPRASDLHTAAEATCDPATSRRWVAAWVEDLEKARAPHLVQSV